MGDGACHCRAIHGDGLIRKYACSKWPPVSKVWEQLPKNEAEEGKSIQTSSLCYSNAKSTRNLHVL